VYPAANVNVVPSKETGVLIARNDNPLGGTNVVEFAPAGIVTV
jgi:hypothetical protein